MSFFPPLLFKNANFIYIILDNAINLVWGNYCIQHFSRKCTFLSASWYFVIKQKSSECLPPHPYVVTVCNSSTCPLTSPLVLPDSQPHPPCCLTHLIWNLSCSSSAVSQYKDSLWLIHSVPDCSLPSWQTFQRIYLLRISWLRLRFVLTSPPCLCPGKNLCLLFPTTIFTCVLPVSWLPVYISATLQKAPAKILMGFFSLMTPPRSPGLFWIIDSLSWFSC